MKKGIVNIIFHVFDKGFNYFEVLILMTTMKKKNFF